MTTPTTNQRDWAEAPAFTPLPHTLLDVSPPVPFTGHQKLGVMYQVDSCATPLEYNVACVTGTGAAKSPTADVLWRAADPFVVYSWLPCTFAGGEPPEKLKADTLAAHRDNVARTVGSIFWTGGNTPTSQKLASNTSTIITSGGSDVVLQTAATVVTGTGNALDLSIGLLEQSMADCYGGTPFLHIPRKLIAILASMHQLQDRDGALYTKGGSRIVAYSGPNTGPDGTAAPAGFAWVYATSPVKVWAGPVQWTADDAAEILRRDINGTVLIAEQRFAAGWGCCHFASLVSLDSTP